MSEHFYIVITYVVLISVFIGFLYQRVRPHLVAVTGMVFLLIVGAIDTKDMMSVFSNSAPITIACLFIISAALDQTGIINTLGRFLLKLATKNKYLAIVSMILVVLVVSAFVNNTPVVIILTPVIIVLAEKLKDYPSKYLIPLSYAAIMGGTCTLIGTSTNLVVNSIAQEYGQPAFGMFEITGVGVLMASAGLAFMALVGRFLLPERKVPKDVLLEGRAPKRFMAEAVISFDSFLIGKSINEIKFTESEEYEIIDLVRKDSGSRLTPILSSPRSTSLFQRLFANTNNSSATAASATTSSFRDIKLQGGDRLIFKLSKNEIIELQKHVGIEFDRAKAQFSTSLPTREVVLAEGIVPSTSQFIGMRVRDLRLRRSYGCFVIAVHRQDKNISGDISNLVLREGDSLILDGSEEDLNRLFEERNIMNATFMRRVDLQTAKAPIAIATIIGILVFSTLGVMPIVGLAMIGAVVVMLTGCVTPEKAYQAIDWRILMLIFGMLGIGQAMDNTGAVKLLVDYAVVLVEGLGPVMLLACIYLLASILTEMITNNAVALLLTPIVIGLVSSLGFDPRPFVVAVMFGASASFATPIGYQTNTFVYAAGGYKFTDFLKIGIPLNIIMLVVATFIIPIFFPF